MLWEPDAPARIYAGEETARETRDALRLPGLPDSAPWGVSFGHRRLSIVDLSPAGHQPMIHRETGLTLVYNGEVYNHPEIRRELERLGHDFRSHCDTEVLLAAWAEWGPECLARLNGMFSFVILDPRTGTVHAVRDRFGVKPLYWARIGDVLGIASEIKQLRSLPGYAPSLDGSTVHDYLAAGLLDHTRQTFDTRIQQLVGGELLSARVADVDGSIAIRRWYELKPSDFTDSFHDAAREFRRLLRSSIELRLRADVPVGSCLSGGLDSSAIVCLASEVLAGHGSHAGQVTVTARYDDPRFDEWQFAEQVIEASGAHGVVIWPTVERLQAEIDDQLWYMDEPFGSTSQFSQWCVFAGAADSGLTVMLDGQGADEQLAGYNGNDTALYSGLMRRLALQSLLTETRSFRGRHGAWPIAQLLLAARNVVPAIDAVLPARLRHTPGAPDWLGLRAPTHRTGHPAADLNSSLIEQTLSTSLPVLLRYEDRNSMAWSIESRVPFLDFRLVEFLAGLPAEWKLRGGLTKLVMREALRGVLPEPVRDRRDKMGFVTPEQVWLRESATPWFRAEVDAAIDTVPDVLDPDATRRMLDDTIAGRAAFSFDPWRVLCFGRWIRQQRDSSRRATTNAAAPRHHVVA